MKIEQVIVLHLYNTKEVTLQGIGTFRLNSPLTLPSEVEKDIVIPENAVSFDYNPKATEDAGLIDSIVKHTTKIKPLASADLDSFLMLGRQFLNIGKPFVLDKIGTLDKAQTGELIFIPGQFITPKIEAPKALKENENEESSGLFNDYNREPENNNKKIIAIIIAIIIAGLAGWGVYHFMFTKKTPATQSTPVAPSTVIIDSVPKNNTAVNKITADTTIHLTGVNDSSFNIIIRQTNNKKEALSYFKRLNRWGHHVVMYTQDSINFKLVEIINLPLSDTTRVKDSLSRFYHAPVSIQLK